MDNEKNTHNMITRSKKNNLDEEPENDKKLVLEKVDSNGNLMDLIDDSEPGDFDELMLKKEIERLRGGSPKKSKSPAKKIRKGRVGKKTNIIDLVLPYLIMKSLTPEVKKKKSKKSRKTNINNILMTDNIEIKVEEMDEDDSFEDENSEEETSDEDSNSESPLESDEDIEFEEYYGE
jgi:hypothetical protein